MNQTIPFPDQTNFAALAAEKIETELKDFSGDNKAKAVSKFVASTLKNFCEQDERFAEVVYKTVRTLSDCCSDIMKGVGSSVSDIDVYRGAVRHYFPNSDIDFTMKISLTGDAPSEDEMNKKPEKPAAKPRKDKKVSAPPKTAAAKPAPKPKPEPESIQLSLF